MLYAVICHDKPDSVSIRKANREAHLDHLKNGGLSVTTAGPFLSEKGEMVGSLIVFEADSLEDVERWTEQDPYARAGLFESVIIRAWNRVI